MPVGCGKKQMKSRVFRKKFSALRPSKPVAKTNEKALISATRKTN
jgi:hypothetical protein